MSNFSHRSKQLRLSIEPWEELSEMAGRIEDRIAEEQRRADKLAAELEADRARHAEQQNELRLALTVAMDALKSASPRNESGALKIAAAKRTAAALIKGAA